MFVHFLCIEVFWKQGANEKIWVIIYPGNSWKGIRICPKEDY